MLRVVLACLPMPSSWLSADYGDPDNSQPNGVVMGGAIFLMLTAVRRWVSEWGLLVESHRIGYRWYHYFSDSRFKSMRPRTTCPQSGMSWWSKGRTTKNNMKFSTVQSLLSGAAAAASLVWPSSFACRVLSWSVLLVAEQLLVAGSYKDNKTQTE